MASITKFYFHNTAAGHSTPAGTQSAVVDPPVVATNGNTNYIMNGTIGSAQASRAATTAATTATQSLIFGRWVSDPLNAQTISTQTVTLRFAASTANASSDLFELGGWMIYLWRPGTNSLVTKLYDGTSASSGNLITEPGTSQTALTSAKTTTFAGTAQLNDLLVFELVSNQAQSMGSAYLNTVFFDGTTEGSTTSNAAHIEFTNAVNVQDAAPPADAGFPYTGGGYYAMEKRNWFWLPKKRLWLPQLQPVC